MRLGLGIPGARRTAPSGPALNRPTLVVQESGVDTHAETELADLSTRTTVDDGDGFPTIDVELYESGALIGSTVDGGGGLWTLAQNDRAPGSYSYRAKRITAAGNKFSAAWAVVVSAVAPTLTEPDGGEAITTGDVFELTATTVSDANTTGVTFHVTGPSAYDQTFTGVLDTGVWEYSWDTTGLADGEYEITAIRAGSWGTVSSTPASVDVASGAPVGDADTVITDGSDFVVTDGSDFVQVYT